MSEKKTDIHLLDDDVLLKRAFELLYTRFGVEGFARIIRRLGVNSEEISAIRDELEKEDSAKIFDELEKLDNSER